MGYTDRGLDGQYLNEDDDLEIEPEEDDWDGEYPEGFDTDQTSPGYTGP